MTRDAILRTFTALERAGLRTPTAIQADLTESADLWAAVLADIDESALRAALLVYLRTPDGRFWPTPGALLALVPGRQSEATVQDEGVDAWAQLLRSIRRWGQMRPPGTEWALDEDPDRADAIAAGLDGIGGWSAACALPVNDAPARRAFIDGYLARRQRQVRDVATAGPMRPALTGGSRG